MDKAIYRTYAQMFKGFNLKVTSDSLENTLPNIKHFSSIESSKVQKNIKEISNYLKNGVLDGSKIKSDWFPEGNFDIFLSHSHADKDLALLIANVLRVNFGLNVFIDSEVWGFADNLLREIDDKYALAPSKETYEYQVRNRTTSNVHLMLNSALNEIIDKSECLIFLNTNKSVYTDKNLYDEKTYTASPWIMSELYFSSRVRRHFPDRYKQNMAFNESLRKSVSSNEQAFVMLHDLPVSHLEPLTEKNLINWLQQEDTTDPLGYLYNDVLDLNYILKD